MPPVQVWSSLTSPISPDHRISHAVLVPSWFQPWFPRGSGQGLLAIDVLAVLHGEQRHRRMHVIRGCDHYRVEVLRLGLEHLAIVLVLFGLRVLREAGGGASVVHVAQSHDVLGRGGA